MRDDGNLGLDEVFNLIVEGENLPVSVEKELKVQKPLISCSIWNRLVSKQFLFKVCGRSVLERILCIGSEKMCCYLITNSYLSLQKLRSRSKLYCICRMPYRRDDRRVWIACNQCDEWYHIDCVKLISIPKYYICPACKPPLGEWEYRAEKSSPHEM